MNELLFKLKKDSKTVGYLKIQDGELFIGTQPDKVRFIVHHQFNINGPYLWGAKYPMAGANNAQQKEGHNTCSIKFDTIHPFVHHDKNNNPMFSADLTNYGAIAWDSIKCGWVVLQNIEDYASACDANENKRIGVTHSFDMLVEDIELIEEEECL